jgi:hypothetical protein
MKKYFVVFTILILPMAGPVDLFSQQALQLENPDIFLADESAPGCLIDLGLDCGMFFGMINEWLFYDKNNNNTFDFVQSRLDWELEPLFYAGAAGSVELVPRFFIGFGGWLGIPGALGFMQDRDWDLASGNYIRFSRHENVAESALFADINFGYSLVREKMLILNGIMGFNFKRFCMSGQNGYRENPPGTSPMDFSGVVVNYELNFFIPYIALETAWAPLAWLTIDALISTSPFLTFVYARDSRISGDYFLDFPQFGFFFTGILNVSLHLGDGFNLLLNNMLIWAPPFKGKTYTRLAGQNYSTTDPSSRGGAGLVLYGISLSLVYGIGN